MSDENHIVKAVQNAINNPPQPILVRQSELAALSGSDASTADERLATRLIYALSRETLYKADLFDYLCWLEETHQSENVKGCKYLVLASDGTTCWGNTYADAVKVAMHHDKELYDAVCDLEANPPNEKGQA